MDFTTIISDVFGKYQAHIFAALVFLIRMQFRANKNFEVHQKCCEGKFHVQDVINKNIKANVRENKKNLDQFFKVTRPGTESRIII